MNKHLSNNGFTSPNRNNEHNYMLDTSVFNDLCYQEDKISKLQKSLDYGFKYYYTYIQIVEMRGLKYNVEEGILEDKSSKELEEKRTEFEKIINRLNVNEILHVGTLGYTFILDGSTCALPTEYGEFANSIRKGNLKHNEDMIIAVSAILQGCILVTNDNDLFKKAKRTYPDNVIKVEDLLYRIDNLKK